MGGRGAVGLPQFRSTDICKIPGLAMPVGRTSIMPARTRDLTRAGDHALPPEAPVSPIVVNNLRAQRRGLGTADDHAVDENWEEGNLAEDFHRQEQTGTRRTIRRRNARGGTSCWRSCRYGADLAR